MIYDPSIDRIAGLNGSIACVDFRSYGDVWLRGQLTIDSVTPVATPPHNVEISELASQRSCLSEHNRYWTFTVTDMPVPKPGPTIHIIEQPVFTEQLAFALAKPADPALRERLNSIIDGMRTDGTIARVSSDWLTGDLSQPPP